MRLQPPATPRWSCFKSGILYLKQIISFEQIFCCASLNSDHGVPGVKEEKGKLSSWENESVCVMSNQKSRAAKPPNQITSQALPNSRIYQRRRGHMPHRWVLAPKPVLDCPLQMAVLQNGYFLFFFFLSSLWTCLLLLSFESCGHIATVQWLCVSSVLASVLLPVSNKIPGMISFQEP